MNKWAGLVRQSEIPYEILLFNVHKPEIDANSINKETGIQENLSANVPVRRNSRDYIAFQKIQQGYPPKLYPDTSTSTYTYMYINAKQIQFIVSFSTDRLKFSIMKSSVSFKYVMTLTNYAPCKLDMKVEKIYSIRNYSLELFSVLI